MNLAENRTRTNIELDDRLLEIVMRRYGARTKTDAVHLALSSLAGLPLTIEEILAMQGAKFIGKLPHYHFLRHLEPSSSET